MNIIKKRTPKFLSAILISFILFLGVPTPAGGELFSCNTIRIEPFAQELYTINTFEKMNKMYEIKETIQSVIDDLNNNYTDYLSENTIIFLRKKLKSINTITEEETLQKILDNCNKIREQILEIKRIEEKIKYEAYLETIGQNIENAAHITPATGPNLCGAWITYVFMNAGYNNINGDANEMYYNYCFSSDRNAMREGMIIAVPTHNQGGWPGLKWGHVGILLKDNNNCWYVMDNTGCVNQTPLDDWIIKYGQLAQVQWGWAIPV